LQSGFVWIPCTKLKIILQNKERFPLTDNG
jgi:hypothetical protein